jgi:TatD DNase family protein
MTANGVELGTSGETVARSGLADVHAHLCDSVFDQDRAEVIERARKAGLSAIIAVGENLADARRNLELAESHTVVRAAAGLHPAAVDRDQALEMYGFIRQHRNSLTAIGEVGLDYWVIREEPQLEVQREIFRGFIELSKELDLPLNVHSRSAGRHAIALLLEHGARKVHLHAFDGRPASALPGVEAGFFFSVPPSAVRSQQKQKLVRHLPLSCLLVETDSPVLGLSPTERNEPANARISLKFIAEMKGIDEEEAAAAVRENTRRIYGKL